MTYTNTNTAHDDRRDHDTRGSAKDRRNRRNRIERESVARFGRLLCTYCGREVQDLGEAAATGQAVKPWALTVDRIVPGRSGGAYNWGNVAPACDHCNRLKGDQPWQLFAAAADGMSYVSGNADGVQEDHGWDAGAIADRVAFWQSVPRRRSARFYAG